jgi:uncharacterized protein YciI
MKHILLALPLLLIIACGQDKQPAEQAPAKDTAAVKADTAQMRSLADGEMKTYYMVFLNEGADRTQDSATAAKIQEQHLAHLTKMWNEHKMHLAGPFLDEGTTKGICVYNVASAEEAKTFAEEDPAVKSGRLKVEVRPWMTLKSRLE